VKYFREKKPRVVVSINIEVLSNRSRRDQGRESTRVWVWGRITFWYGDPLRLCLWFLDGPGGGELSVLHDCQWIPVENVLTSGCSRNLRGSEKIELLAEILAMVHDFSRYVLGPSSLPPLQQVEGMVAALRNFYRSHIQYNLHRIVFPLQACYLIDLINERKRTEAYRFLHLAAGFCLYNNGTYHLYTSPGIVSCRQSSTEIDYGRPTF
jgi:hypothetical protein